MSMLFTSGMYHYIKFDGHGTRMMHVPDATGIVIQIKSILPRQQPSVLLKCINV